MPTFSQVWIPLLLGAGLSFAQPSSPPVPRNSDSADPITLVRVAVHRETRLKPDAHYMFSGTKMMAKGSTTRIYVETTEATAGMIVAQNGRPLSPEQRRDEEARIDRFVREPEELRKKKRQEQEDAERTLRIVRALPDAFLFEYAGEEQSSPGVGRLGDPLVKIKFRPNPKYDPPSRIEEVLTGMQGELLIDPMCNRLAKIDGVLFKSVSFGWGILGRLDKGGHFLVTQQEVDDDDWEISRMKLNFTGKVLLLKSISIQSNEVFGDFKRVPGMTFAQGVELLKKQERPVENNSKSSGMTPN